MSLRFPSPPSSMLPFLPIYLAFTTASLPLRFPPLFLLSFAPLSFILPRFLFFHPTRPALRIVFFPILAISFTFRFLIFRLNHSHPFPFFRLSPHAPSPHASPPNQRHADNWKHEDELGPLPEGWEQRVHTDGRIFFIDHSEWRQDKPRRLSYMLSLHILSLQIA